MAGSRAGRFIKTQYISKNQSIRNIKEKKKKIELFKEEVESLAKLYEKIDPSKIEKFDDFPLTDKTKKGLKKWGYTVPTEIQKESIGLALKGHDILGAAKTGSGKTLAFAIPILENLYCSGWSMFYGLGVLIITPTRELAYQIFEVLKKIGSKHYFSVALVIGGKDLEKERQAINKCNIIICTPGRLLQHMDENPLFDASNLKILVLDEADRILDLGFEKSINAILENLPTERQTLLFSATQTKSVRDLARLSLKNPLYVSVHEHAKFSTPETLQQSYMICEAESKMNFLWSFLKNHKKNKILVFMSCCHQVKYIFEVFCRMRPGISVTALYGTLHQLRRMKIYDDFCKSKAAVMFATDIASRGLDFPNVDWVVQLDCPEDVNTYIHRAGRTARYKQGGESLLILLPSEKESMLTQLASRKIPIEELKVNPQRFLFIQKKMEAHCARDVNLKDSAQRAFKSYLKSVFLMKDKTVFDISGIDTDAYALSLGLAFPPRVRFLERHLKKTNALPSKKENTEENNSLFADCDSDDDLLKPKQTSIHTEIDEEDETTNPKKNKVLTKQAVAKKFLKKNIKLNSVIKYDKEGNPLREVSGKVIPHVAKELHEEMLETGYDVAKAKAIMTEEDHIDKILYREKMKQKHKEKKRMLKEQNIEQNSEYSVRLGNPKDEDEGSDEDEDVDPNNMMSSDNESEDGDSASESEQDEESDRGEKRKADNLEIVPKRQRVQTDEIWNSKKLSIEDDESLALHFLTNT